MFFYLMYSFCSEEVIFVSIRKYDLCRDEDISSKCRQSCGASADLISDLMYPVLAQRAKALDILRHWKFWEILRPLLRLCEGFGFEETLQHNVGIG